jgi:hypothetical protein
MASWNSSCPAVLALGVLLSGCGGAGGGGTASTAPAPAAAPAVTTTSGGPVNLQAANSTVIYQAAAVYGSDNAVPGSSTITLTTDASGNLKAVDFNLLGLRGRDASPSLSLTSPLTVDLRNLVLVFRETFGTYSTTGYTISQVAGAQTLSSSAYGLWASGNPATLGTNGALAFGNLTPAASVPATGSATFNGTATGLGTASSGDTVYALQGNAQIVANFSSQSVTTSLKSLNTINISTSATGSVPDLTGTSAISGNAYSGAIGGGGLAGTIAGNFYGAPAQETAGVWHASGGGIFWGGSYGAK